MFFQVSSLRRNEKQARTKVQLKQSKIDKKKGTNYQSGIAIHLITNKDLRSLSKKRKLHDFLKSSILNTNHKNSDTASQNLNKKRLIVLIL